MFIKPLQDREKHFTLAVEYIKLLILNPRAYRQILAVTFTNKATAEMKERILSQLYGIQTSDKDSEAYLNRIKEETGKTEQEIREAAGVAPQLYVARLQPFSGRDNRLFLPVRHA